jgi:TonB-dependent receptor
MLTVFLFPSMTFAQGIISGTVSDSTNKDPLIGANVIVSGTSLGCATDRDGKYRITGVPAGARVLRVSYIGYNAKKIEVLITGGEKSIDVDLAPEAIQGQVVEVYGQLRGQMAAINQQVSSKTIVNIVSEEKIQELPDANAAEAIGRLPGVSLIRTGGEASGVILRGMGSKFTNITIDGVKIPPTEASSRDVDLSMMSQGSLSGIELYKTLTPDQDADAIAGGINFVTHKAPSERMLRADVKGDYNALMKSTNQYDLAIRYGQRFFDDLIGLQIVGGMEKKVRSMEQISYTYTTTDNGALGTDYDKNLYDNDYHMTEFDVRFTDEMRTRKSIQGIFDINTPDSGSIKISGMYASTDRNIMQYERTYLTWDYIFENKELITTTKNASIQGKNYLLGLTVDWNVSYADSRVKNPHDFRLLFYEPNGGTWPGDIKSNPEQIFPLTKNNYASALLDSSAAYKNENFEKENTYQINLSRNVTLGNSLTDMIKIGAKYKEKNRWKSSYGYGWNNYSGVKWLNSSGTDALTGTPFDGTTDHAALSYFINPNEVRTRDLLGKYTMSPLIDVNLMNQWEDLTKNATMAASSSINQGVLGILPASDFSVKERVSAGYIMNTLDFGQALTVIIGARIESENNDYFCHYTTAGATGTGFVLQLASANIMDTTTNYKKSYVLPNLQMIYKPTDFLNVRLAAYEALARPDFSARMPEFSYISSGTWQINLSNPSLPNATAWNFEANTQWYGSKFGLFTVSGFYKKIDNLFHQTNNLRTSWAESDKIIEVNGVRYTSADIGYYYRLDNALADMGLSQWYNNTTFKNIIHSQLGYSLNAWYSSPKSSSVWGFEVEHQTNLGFISPSYLQNVTLSYNFTVQRSASYIYLQKHQVDSVFTPAVWGKRRDGTPYIKSDSSYAVGTYNYIALDKKPMEDQPQFFGNAALGYDIGGFSARISVFYQSRYTRSYSGDGTSDAIVDEFIKWDLVLKQQINSYISASLNINNLFNRQETRSSYNNIFDWGYRPSSASLYGTTVDFGIRVNL